MNRHILAAALTAAVLVSAQAGAQPPKRWAAWQFQWENDAFALFSGSDEHYTNGIRFSWIRNPEHRAVPGWIVNAGNGWCRKTKLCGTGAGDPTANLGHSVSQTFYTPEDITVPQLIVTDRPYAAYLHFGTQVFLRNDENLDVLAGAAPDPDRPRKRPTQNYFELQLGFLGPEAGGEWIQTEAHEIIDDDIPQGWDNQLHFEPVVQAIYLWRRKLGGRYFDLVPEWGAGLGNVMVYVNAGATARFGWNLSGFLAPTIAPTVALTAAPVDQDIGRWELYGFVGAAGRGVAHNVFLDGNTFRDSHSVDKENWVYDLKAGFVARYKKCRLTYTFTRRSRELSSTLDDDGGRHDYGSVAFTYLATWKPPGS